jgi:PhoH-like ATPase
MAEYKGVVVIDVRDSVVNKIYKDKSVNITSVISGALSEPEFKYWHLSPHCFIVLKAVGGSGKQTALSRVSSDCATLVLLTDYQKSPVSGLRPRNKEQNMLLNTLMDPAITCQIVTGLAGGGKTLCSIAAAFYQTFERDDLPYNRIILTRPMDPVGKTGLGALPGTVEEKFSPYLANFFSNFSCLLGEHGDSYIRMLMENKKIEMVPLQLIGGASYSNAFILADEVQSLDEDEMYALGTRVSENSKIILMGDYRQRYGTKGKLSETGLYTLMNSSILHRSKFAAAIKLIKQERSEIAGLFTEIFDWNVEEEIKK